MHRHCYQHVFRAIRYSIVVAVVAIVYDTWVAMAALFSLWVSKFQNDKSIIVTLHVRKLIQLLRIDSSDSYVIHLSGTNKEEHGRLHYDSPVVNHFGLCCFNNKLKWNVYTNALCAIWFNNQHVLSRKFLPRRGLINIQMNTIDAGCVCVSISFQLIVVTSLDHRIN